MGFSSCHSLNQLKMIKSIVFACLAVAAYAEPEAKADADPALVYSAAYGAYPYSVGYHGYAGYPYSLGAYNYGAYPYVHAIGKREAEAKADADPALVYSAAYGAYPYSVGYHGYAGYPYSLGA